MLQSCKQLMSSPRDSMMQVSRFEKLQYTTCCQKISMLKPCWQNLREHKRTMPHTLSGGSTCILFSFFFGLQGPTEMANGPDVCSPLKCYLGLQPMIMLMNWDGGVPSWQIWSSWSTQHLKCMKDSSQVDSLSKNQTRDSTNYLDDLGLKHVNKIGKISGGMIGITRSDSARNRWGLTCIG